MAAGKEFVLRPQTRAKNTRACRLIRVGRLDCADPLVRCCERELVAARHHGTSAGVADDVCIAFFV